ncbi:hypothetical protein JW960_05180 [candidate division KSB1 bacterium]|nr:hypothetical protein [candidate division KSB1 bacterium]
MHVMEEHLFVYQGYNRIIHDRNTDEIIMSEMLANQYFMARKYKQACDLFEQEIARGVTNKSIRSKLIICYIQAGQVIDAWKIFVGLVAEDVEFIIKLDPIRDDCPCPDLVFELGNGVIKNQNNADYYLTSGMIWLYCDAKKSLTYLKDALAIDPQNQTIAGTISIINSYVCNSVDLGRSTKISTL